MDGWASAPEKPFGSDPSLIGHKLVTEIGAKLSSERGSLHPQARGKQAIALRGGWQILGVVPLSYGRTKLRRCTHATHASGVSPK